MARCPWDRPQVRDDRLEGRTALAGREMLAYAIDRETWLSRARQESLLAS